MQHPERESKSSFVALEVCEAKRTEALHSMLDGVNIAHHPGTEASVLVDPDETDRITYFVLHWPSSGENAAPQYLRYWIKEYYHGTDDWDIQARDYVVDKGGTVLEVMGVTPLDDIPVTEEDKFIPYILDLAELPRAIDEIMPVSTLDPTEYDTLLERLARSIPAVH